MAERVLGECTLPLSDRFPPPKSTHHGCVILCWWVWDHLCSLALSSFWLPLRHMQWLSPTLPAYSLSRRWVLVPSPPLHPFLCSSPPDSSLWQAGVQQGEPRVRTHPLHRSPLSTSQPPCNMSCCVQPYWPNWSPLRFLKAQRDLWWPEEYLYAESLAVLVLRHRQTMKGVKARASRVVVVHSCHNACIHAQLSWTYCFVYFYKLL